MNDSKSVNIKTNKNKINESHKENRLINIGEEPINIKSITKNINYQFDKNKKTFFINNQNNKDLISSINNNTYYKNIILNNMITPNKKLVLNGKSSSKDTKNIKIERNILYNNNQTEKKFKTLGQNKQKSLDKNNALKLIINGQEQEGINLNNNMNDIEAKYKLILYEKNNLINKLKSEVEYYKNNYQNINMNMNIIIPNSSNTIEASSSNRISLGLKTKKNLEGENMRNKIKNIFSLPKKENKINNNHLLQHNINDYNVIKTFVNKQYSDNFNYLNSENAKDFVPQIKSDFNTISDNETINHIGKKLLLSNETIKNGIKTNNKLDSKNSMTLNNIFNRSNSNTNPKKGKKLKLGFQKTELNLDMNNNDKYYNIKSNRIYNNSVKNKKNLIYSINLLNSNNGSDNEYDIINNSNNYTINVEENINRKRFWSKNKNYFNKITSSPSSLRKDRDNKNLYDINNSGDLITINDNNNDYNNSININKTTFNYRENFDKIKQRMNILINNLFELIEIYDKKQ